MDDRFTSILMLTYNAPEYVRISIDSVHERTEGVDYELVVVDNASDQPTRGLVQELAAQGKIDRLELSPVNTLFAGGNNLAARYASENATHFLLLNSDIEIKSPNWLTHLHHIHQRGITTYGVATSPARVDGYCLLIDADLYRERLLCEDHQWWWSVTKLQADLLADGYTVQGLGEHEQYLHHFGGKSGDAFKNAKGMDVSRREVLSWFGERRPMFVDEPKPSFSRRLSRKVARLLGHRLPKKVFNQLDK
jgi:glycosyltransferase involved in cell wall biosynthesis